MLDYNPTLENFKEKYKKNQNTNNQTKKTKKYEKNYDNFFLPMILLNSFKSKSSELMLSTISVDSSSDSFTGRLRRTNCISSTDTFPHR